MFLGLAKKIFGSANDRIIKSFRNKIIIINSLEAEYINLSDDELKNKTNYFRKLLSSGKTLDDIMPEAFAVVREASKRTIGLRHFDVQLIGGMVLHNGMISEMRTGEGKTLVSTLAAYLNALSGMGVHIITVNDYLAKRDSEWMGKIYSFLGMSVGCIIHGVDDIDRKQAYNSDITYGTNNEFGFDYLRDNMKFSASQMVQGKFNFAIIDEVDSILIDEARTPLIISGPTEDNSDLYSRINRLIPLLSQEDYEKDEKSKSVVLTDNGINHVEELLYDNNILDKESNLYNIENISLVHHVNQALKAHILFTRDVDYMVSNNKIMIIDEFTGRMMEGRRYSEGLHQALEAKENVAIQNENQTLASITFQNYFRLYPKLSGMTGTAMTEANEFKDIYNLEVVDVPTHNLVKRIDDDDEIYRSSREKYNAIIDVIEENHKNDQPILVGTISIEKSEYISSLLKKKKIKHNVLNAKYHEQEASIIAQAGRAGAVTIATNMAGRGTDIMLGGNASMLISEYCKNLEGIDLERKIDEIKEQVSIDKEKVMNSGGLLVIATERHESRRIDNQLRGRSGRQGDPGRTKFYLSLEDDLMRIFSSDKLAGPLIKLGLKEGEAIFHPLISKALERAQKKVESFNYEIRKNLLKFDNVMNEQRKIIYEQRIEIMNSIDISDTTSDMYNQIIEDIIDKYISKDYEDIWNLDSLYTEIHKIFNIDLELDKDNINRDLIIESLENKVKIHLNQKQERFGSEIYKQIEKKLLLHTIDSLWKDHLYSLDNLRQGINLRAYGQKDPLSEYKREAFNMFESMLSNIRSEYIEKLSHTILSDNYVDDDSLFENIDGKITLNNMKSVNDQSWNKVGRNELCPCGSERKFKHCHGRLVN